MFAKLFKSLWYGSMSGQSDLQLVFVCLLAHAELDGVVDLKQEVIAALTGIPLDRVRVALQTLEAPDPSSRSEAEGGRRIIRKDAHRDWGWEIVNYQAYRDMRNGEERRKQNREAQARRRQRESADVSSGQHESAHVEGDVDAEVDASLSGPAAPRATEADRFVLFWKSYPSKVGKKAAASAFHRAIKLTTVEVMLDAIESQKRSKRWTEGYIPNPATWLNQGRWDDEVQAFKASQATGAAAVAEFVKGGTR